MSKTLLSFDEAARFESEKLRIDTVLSILNEAKAPGLNKFATLTLNSLDELDEFLLSIQEKTFDIMSRGGGGRRIRGHGNRQGGADDTDGRAKMQLIDFLGTNQLRRQLLQHRIPSGHYRYIFLVYNENSKSPINPANDLFEPIFIPEEYWRPARAVSGKNRHKNFLIWTFNDTKPLEDRLQDIEIALNNRTKLLEKEARDFVQNPVRSRIVSFGSNALHDIWNSMSTDKGKEFLWIVGRDTSDPNLTPLRWCSQCIQTAAKEFRDQWSTEIRLGPGNPHRFNFVCGRHNQPTDPKDDSIWPDEVLKILFAQPDGSDSYDLFKSNISSVITPSDIPYKELDEFNSKFHGSVIIRVN